MRFRLDKNKPSAKAKITYDVGQDLVVLVVRHADDDLNDRPPLAELAFTLLEARELVAVTGVFCDVAEIRMKTKSEGDR